MRFATLLSSIVFTVAAVSVTAQEAHFEAFTGKVTGHNVRMRLQPNLDAQVFKELDKDELLLVTGLVDDFYACMPPKGLKGYIFRTYVLDGVVEGTNVFVRLGPDRTSPSVAQLNSGDPVKGSIAAQNNKWLQIDLPEDVRFYVAKDYVQKAGNVNFYAEQETKRQDALKTLNTLEADLDKELEKPFSKIQLAKVSEQLNQFIRDHKDMPQAVSQAEAMISRMQEIYLTKSVASADEQAPVEEEKKEETKPSAKNAPEKPTSTIQPPAPARPVTTMVSWQSQENAYLQNLIAEGEAETSDSYYAEELKKANTLHGTIKPYNSFINTRPGDYVLLNLKTNLPIAYLYSTKVDLAASVGKPVTVWISERPNNNFAFPAYFVLQIEE